VTAVEEALRGVGYTDVVGLDDFLTWSEWALARVGFRPSNCLPVVSVCRDELMAPVDEGVRRVWGQPFWAGALAGLPFLGRTGMRAALGHAPGEDGRHRFVLFCLPHIGIDADGTVGRVHRRGMHRASAACGALAAYLSDIAGGATVGGLDPDDIEQSLLQARLRTLVEEGVPSLVELTELTRQASVSDLRRFISLVGGDEPVDVACISGVVVHLPDGQDVVAHVDADVRIDAVVHVLPH
jgi:hypothetical protein